jgi:hypothetical protein
MPEYFDRYINMADDVDVLTAIETSITELKNLPVEKWVRLGNKVYAPGKWTAKDILQHLIDTERVFSYRATAFARGENKVMPFDEELYGRNANANARELDSLIEEAICLRTSFLHLYKSFDANMLNATGIGIKGEYSVASIGFIIAGHQRWHFRILEEKYFPLILG